MVEAKAPPRDLVDLRPLKERFREIYPPGHLIRAAIEAEDDLLPRAVALPKLEAYAHMVAGEADRSRRRAIGAATS